QGNEYKFIVANSFLEKDPLHPVGYNFSDYGKVFYTELAKVDLSNKKDLLKFFRTWGLPLGFVDLNVGNKNDNSEIIDNRIMSLDHFSMGLETFKLFFDFAWSIYNQNLSSEDVIYLYRDNPKNAFKYKIGYNNNSPAPMAIFNDMFEYANFFLTL